jgi:hypothetical protein
VTPEPPDPKPELLPYFALPEYEEQGRQFIQDAIEIYMRASDSLYGRLHVQRVEHVLPSRIPLASGSFFETRPMSGATEFELPGRDLFNGRYRSLMVALAETAKNRLAQVMKQFFKSVDDLTTATDQVVDAGGRPFSYELWLQSLEKIDFDFDREGRPRFPTMVVSPQQYEKIKQLPPPTQEQLNSLERLVSRKREEFVARKRHRRLP